jgi:hypothetical protein
VVRGSAHLGDKACAAFALAGSRLLRKLETERCTNAECIAHQSCQAVVAIVDGRED